MSTPGPAPTVTDEQLISVLRQADTPVLTYGDVSEHVEIGAERVRQRLNTLAEQGRVNRGELNGGSLVVYWVDESS